MSRIFEVNKGLLGYFKQESEALSGQPAERKEHYGSWCRFDTNLFCQERGGCLNCLKSPYDK